MTTTTTTTTDSALSPDHDDEDCQAADCGCESEADWMVRMGRLARLGDR